MILPENLQKELTLLTKIYKVVNIYLTGSRSYQNNSENSDYDFIVIVENMNVDRIEKKFYNGTIFVFRKPNWEKKLKEHDVSALECYFLPQEFKIKEDWKYSLKLDLSLLKTKFCAKAQKSYSKAEKFKNSIESEKDELIKNKNLYHALRILFFMRQILDYNKIIDYTEANNFSLTEDNYKQIFADLFNLGK